MEGGFQEHLQLWCPHSGSDDRPGLSLRSPPCTPLMNKAVVSFDLRDSSEAGVSRSAARLIGSGPGSSCSWWDPRPGPARPGERRRSGSATRDPQEKIKAELFGFEWRREPLCSLHSCFQNQSVNRLTSAGRRLEEAQCLSAARRRQTPTFMLAPANGPRNVLSWRSQRSR